MKSYKVNLIGTTWEGCKGSYSYTFDHLPTDNEIRRKAGDFQDVIDYETIATTREGDWNAETIKREIIDRWQHPESEDEYVDMQHGELITQDGWEDDGERGRR